MNTSSSIELILIILLDLHCIESKEVGLAWLQRLYIRKGIKYQAENNGYISLKLSIAIIILIIAVLKAKTG